MGQERTHALQQFSIRSHGQAVIAAKRPANSSGKKDQQEYGAPKLAGGGEELGSNFLRTFGSPSYVQVAWGRESPSSVAHGDRSFLHFLRGDAILPEIVADHPACHCDHERDDRQAQPGEIDQRRPPRTNGYDKSPVQKGLLRVGEGPDLARVQYFDDLSGCTLGSKDPKPGARLVSRHIFTHRRNIRHRADRLDVVTANIRNSPRLMYENHPIWIFARRISKSETWRDSSAAWSLESGSA